MIVLQQLTDLVVAFKISTTETILADCWLIVLHTTTTPM